MKTTAARVFSVLRRSIGGQRNRSTGVQMTLPRIVVLLAAVLAAPVAALAQAPSSPLPVKLGQHVWVTTTDGSEIEGVVSDVTAATIDVKGVNGTKRLNETDVRRIAKRRDSVKKGAIIGGSIMEGLGIWAVKCCELGTKGTGVIIGALAFDFAAGAGIGALVGYAIKGRETVYERPAGSPSVILSPIVAPHSIGVAGAIRW